MTIAGDEFRSVDSNGNNAGVDFEGFSDAPFTVADVELSERPRMSVYLSQFAMTVAS